MVLEIANFKISNLEKIIEIEKEAFPKKIAFSREAFEEFYFREPENFLVAKVGNEIVGYGIGKESKGKGEIISVAVRENWRRKGIGTKIVERLIENLKRKGARKIFLHVREKNEVAISFYQKLGFKILKKIENYYSNGDSAYLMNKNV